MFEIEKMEREFDYSLVDNDTAEFLRSCEYEMNGIAEDARIQFGRVLKKAQDRLAKYGSGVFSKWYESGGLNKHDVYYAINLYDSSRFLEERQRDNFLRAPKTLQKEVMKKNAPEELKQKVYDGDISTNKEYQKLLKELRETEELREQLKRRVQMEQKERERLEIENEKLANAKPEVIKEEVIKEIDKTDYEGLKRLKEQLEREKKAREEAEKESERNIEALRNYQESYVNPEKEKRSKIVSFKNDLSVGVSNLARNIEQAKQRLDGQIDNEAEIQLAIERAIESLKDQIINLDELRKRDVIEISN